MVRRQTGLGGLAARARQHLSRLRPEAVIAIAAVVPVLLTPYLPGLDAPWHALFVSAIEHADDATDRYLGGLEVAVRFHGYTGFYVLVSALAKVMSVLRAMQVVVALYVVAWVFAAAHLLAAFGRDRRSALAAAPVAYSAALGYGFLPFTMAYPLILWQWAAARRYCRDGHRRDLAVLVATTAALALTHAFAAAVGIGCALLLVAVNRQSGHRLRAALAIVVPGALVAWQLVAMGVNEELPAFMRRVSWWQRLENQPFSSPAQTALELPGNALAFLPSLGAVAYVLGSLSVLAFVHYRSSERAPHREASWLLAIVLLGTFATPFHFDWPRTMVAAQPRLAPLVVVVALLWLTPSRLSSRVVGLVGALALAALVATAIPFARFGAEMSDFDAVVAESSMGKRTLALIEQPVAPERGAAGPLRHVGAYVVVARGGLVSGFPGWARTQPWVPVALRRRLPPAPPPGAPRTFRWERHGDWDQFLIYDEDPTRRFDYLGEHARPVAIRGHWRLYSR